MYNELNVFKPIMDKIVNIHLRGELRGKKWFLYNLSLDLYGILEKIRKHWSYEL